MSAFTREQRDELRKIVREEIHRTKFVVLYHGNPEPVYEVCAVKEDDGPRTLQEILASRGYPQSKRR